MKGYTIRRSDTYCCVYYENIIAQKVKLKIHIFSYIILALFLTSPSMLTPNIKTPQKLQTKKYSGFTLVELIVVITILVIL